MNYDQSLRLGPNSRSEVWARGPWGIFAFGACSRPVGDSPVPELGCFMLQEYGKTQEQPDLCNGRSVIPTLSSSLLVDKVVYSRWPDPRLITFACRTSISQNILIEDYCAVVMISRQLHAYPRGHFQPMTSANLYGSAWRGLIELTTFKDSLEACRNFVRNTWI